MGQCRECREWGTLEETQVSDSPGGGTGGTLGVAGAVRPTVAAHPIGKVSATEARARPTGAGELDQVLGGGIMLGAIMLLIGEPGVNKPALLLDIAAKAAAVVRERGNGSVLYVTGEESASRVWLRVECIDTLDPGLLLAAETKLGALLGHVEAAGPSLLVVDSTQTIAPAQVEDSARGVTQVQTVAGAFIAVTKERNIPVLLVGHVTKDGGVIGSRVLEHLVDTATQFKGDRHVRPRLLRATENCYGPIDEVGCFDLGECDIVGFTDPPGLLLPAIRSEVPGTCVTVTLEGRHPMLMGAQALVAPTNVGSPRRTTSGVDHSRITMTLTALSARLRADTSSTDIYVSTVGGARAVEPATDLVVAISVVSTACDLPTPAGLVAFGEMGLTGGIRVTVSVQRRLAEASRLGSGQVIMLLAGSVKLHKIAGIQVPPVTHVGKAMGAALPRG